MKTETERRLKVLYMDQQWLVEILGHFNGAKAVVLPVIQHLPEGVKVISLHDDYARRAIAIVIEHESFEVVRPGEELEAIAVEQLTFVKKLEYEGAGVKQERL